MTCRSSSRKAGSPSSLKMRWMGLPARATITSSASTSVQPVRSASAQPTLVLPEAMKPTKYDVERRRRHRIVTASCVLVGQASQVHPRAEAGVGVEVEHLLADGVGSRRVGDEALGRDAGTRAYRWGCRPPRNPRGPIS